LTEADGGAFVADHAVELDQNAWQFEAFTELHQYLRWNAAPDRRLEHEAELITGVGEWITEHVLGPVASALARARQPVRLDVPVEAGELAYRPWESARVNGRTLAGHQVSFIVNQLPHQTLDKSGVGEQLRMLAVFSLPEDAGALNLRKERYALARLVHEIAAVNNKGIELRVLQYGATRQRLKDALLEHPGWDVVHLSGHGLPAGLVLEDDAGRRDLITSTDLVGLLDFAADQIKLVTLSACESAAVTATEHLHLLGINLAPSTCADNTEADPLPAVATELVRRLDCAVLAMRYPVVDDFAIDLADSFYNLVLGKGQPVARALALILPEIVAKPPTPSTSTVGGDTDPVRRSSSRSATDSTPGWSAGLPGRAAEASRVSASTGTIRGPRRPDDPRHCRPGSTQRQGRRALARHGRCRQDRLRPGTGLHPPGLVPYDGLARRPTRGPDHRHRTNRFRPRSGAPTPRSQVGTRGLRYHCLAASDACPD
jgi:hypothetical protein